MIGIVVSRADSASELIGDHLLNLADWKAKEDASRPEREGGGTYYTVETGATGFELRTFEEWHLELDGVAEAFSDPRLVVFASRHSGETGPLLTAHFTGNFGEAEFGGEGGEFAEACPAAHKQLLENFRAHAPEGYDIGMECTHHGPTAVGAPSLFAELGSGEDEWEDDEAARAVARSILALDGIAHQAKQVVAFGGGHYVPRPERVVRETPWAVGHIGADWSLEAMGGLDSGVIEQVFEKSESELAVIDGAKPALESVIEELGYRVVSETWLREVGDSSLKLISRLESELGTIDSGVRLGEFSTPIEEFSVERLPTEIIEESRAVDAEAVKKTVERRALAFCTIEGGTEIGRRAAFETEENRETMVDDLVSILEAEYEVERGSDTVIVREQAFDPEKALERGVPEGPAFGKLASGETVEIDGRMIEPDSVFVESERKLSYRS